MKKIFLTSVLLMLCFLASGQLYIGGNSVSSGWIARLDGDSISIGFCFVI